MSKFNNLSNDSLDQNEVDYCANRKYKDSLFRLLFGREENNIIVFIVVGFCCSCCIDCLCCSTFIS